MHDNIGIVDSENFSAHGVAHGVCAVEQGGRGGVVQAWQITELVLAPDDFDGARVVGVAGLAAQVQRVAGAQPGEDGVAIVVLAAGDAAVLQVQFSGPGRGLVGAGQRGSDAEGGERLGHAGQKTAALYC